MGMSPVFASTGSTFVRIAVKGKRRRLPAQAQGRDELGPWRIQKEKSLPERNLEGREKGRDAPDIK